MWRTRFFTALLSCVFLTAFLRADCTKDQDHRSSKNSGFLITDFTISGTQTLSSDELATIESELIGSCFDENSEELEGRVQALFKNRGYLSVEVKSLRVKPIDPIGVPKPAMLEAEVLEGPLYRLAEINFTGNHAFTADELRSKFLLKKGICSRGTKSPAVSVIFANSMSPVASSTSWRYPTFRFPPTERPFSLSPFWSMCNITWGNWKSSPRKKPLTGSAQNGNYLKARYSTVPISTNTLVVIVPCCHPNFRGNTCKWYVTARMRRLM
jgi:hypothetical protein